MPIQKSELLSLRLKLLEAAREPTTAKAISRLRGAFNPNELPFLDDALATLPSPVERTRAARLYTSLARELVPDSTFYAVPVVHYGTREVGPALFARAMTDSDFTVFTGDTTQKMGLPGEIVVFPARSTQLHLLFHFAELAAGMDYSGLVLDELQLHWGVNPTGHVLLYAFVDDGKGGARSLQSCVATIHKKVEEAVNAHSDWRCEILPVQPIDEALRTADRWDMAISFPAELRDCDEATGILRPAPEWRSPPSIMATLATRPDGHTLDVLVSRQYQQINHGGNATIPIQRHPSFLVDDRDVREVLAPAFADMGIEISFRAETKVPDTVEQGDLPILDLDGVWRPKAFYRMPLQTRQMVLSTHYIDVIESEDEADHQNLMAYPYPFRMERLNPVRELIGHFRKDVAAKIRELAEVPGLGYQEFCEVICRDLPPFILVTHASPRTADPINVPVYFFEALHFLKCNGRVFYARDGLVERLQMTVMERDMPLSQIRSPFPDIYIHLESSIRYATVEGDPVTLNGFFVSEMVSAETERRRLTICPIVTEGTDVITSLLDAFEVDVDDGVERKLYDALATFFQLSVEEVDSDVRAHAIGLATKILFYVDVKSARIVPHNANDSRSLAFLQAKARKATKPGARTSRPLRAYDFIEIGPEDSIRLEQERAERKVGHSLHWRRGHNRMQAHGPHHSLHHKIWIMPQLINKELLGDEAPPPPPKDYDLR